MAESIGMIGRIVANAYYEYQKVRIASMNQIRDIVRKRKEDIGFSEVEKKKTEKTHEKKYTDKALWAMWEQMYRDGVIFETEYSYMIKCWKMMLEAKKIENVYQKAMGEYVSSEIVYMEFLEKVRGIGVVLSANILKEFGDCSKYDNVSKLWAHTGNDVTADGKTPRRQKGVTVTYSPSLRTLTWKISDCLMKSNKGYYRGVYDSEKLKQANRVFAAGVLFEKYGKPYTPEDTKLTKLHAHNRALRKSRKHFLDHYWHAARELNGFDTTQSYVAAVLEHEHITTWREALLRETTPGSNQSNSDMTAEEYELYRRVDE